MLHGHLHDALIGPCLDFMGRKLDLEHWLETCKDIGLIVGVEQLKTLARKAVDVDRRTPLLRFFAFVAVLTLPSWLINIWICLLVLRILYAIPRWATQKAWGWIFSRDNFSF